MKSKKLITTGITGTLLTFALITSSSATVFAQNTDSIKPAFELRQTKPFKNIERSVKNIENGIEIIMTSTDSNTVTKLQNSQHPTPPKEENLNITSTQTNLDNGIKVTITSTDQSIVTKLQTDFKNGHGPRFGKKDQLKDFPKLENVDHKIENITNGVKMTLTSTDPSTVSKLQSRQEPLNPKEANITFTKNNLENGVEITITSTDQETVKKIQAGPQRVEQRVHKFSQKTDDQTAK
ncbi:hypothetical protein IT412_02485 [Candidatus Peregrinibacteria bacterium]|nr:hypothetical protein [Candidatus Peregrinibacteria bacterium]